MLCMLEISKAHSKYCLVQFSSYEYNFKGLIKPPWFVINKSESHSFKILKICFQNSKHIKLIYPLKVINNLSFVKESRRCEKNIILVFFRYCGISTNVYSKDEFFQLGEYMLE